MSKKIKMACVISSYAYIVEHINYGALLQYYALEKALKKRNVNSFWLRFCIEDEHKIRHGLKRAILFLLHPEEEKNVLSALKKFKEFTKCYCNTSTQQYDSEMMLKEHCPEADIYITGSDQVWGGTLAPNYLCFVPDQKVKCSYAASFGKSEIENEQKSMIQPWINRLNLVSVRESSGVDICKEMGINALQVLDPTLLLDANEYPAKHINNAADIFCYFLIIKSREQIYWSAIKNWTEEAQLKVQVACTENTYALFSKQEMAILGPEEWLNGYANASYILTNTFHGTVFAIIFNKPFIVFTQSGKTGKQNERLFSLLEGLSLINRIYDPTKEIKDQIREFIDWEKVNQVILNKRKESEAYIDKMRDYDEKY